MLARLNAENALTASFNRTPGIPESRYQEAIHSASTQYYESAEKYSEALGRL